MSHETLTVFESPTFPFTIELRDSYGRTVKSYPRAAFTSRDRTIADVMSCRNHDAKYRKECAEANRRQLQEAHMEAAGPDLLAAAERALALIKAHFPVEHGRRDVGETWGALEQAIAKAKGRAL